MEPKYYIICNNHYYPDFAIDDWEGPYTEATALEIFDSNPRNLSDKMLTLIKVENNELFVMKDRNV